MWKCKIRLVLLICLLFVVCGCVSNNVDQSPKAKSLEFALEILKNPFSESVFFEISQCKDINALRIIAFSASATAWSMEAGYDVELDNRMDDISIAAIEQLLDIDSEETRFVIERFRQVFHNDGCSSHMLFNKH